MGFSLPSPVSHARRLLFSSCKAVHAKRSERIPMLKMLASIVLQALLIALPLSTHEALAQGEKKTAYAILIDNTGSLRSQFDVVMAASKGIAERVVRRQGSVSIFNFQDNPDKKNRTAVITAGIEWSGDGDELEDYIDNLWIVPGQTTLLDAINQMAERLNAKAAQEKEVFGEKVILLVTDGEERESKIGEKELLKILKESGIKVYAVGLVGELGRQGNLVSKSSKDKATSLLEKLARETGGRAVFPKSRQSDMTTLLDELLAK